MYRTAPPGMMVDPREVMPGVGIRGIVVGHARPDDVLGELGRDCQV